MSIKINELTIENVKRIKAVRIEPAASGLTVIGGRNNQGKTSVLDAIAWALGGDRFRPGDAVREGSTIPPMLNIKLSNGLIVERKGKNSDLKVTDPTGQKGGQQLLNEFVEQLALDLPRFMQASSRDKADTLLRIIGVGDKLNALEAEEKTLYNRRLEIGRIADQKLKFAKEMPYYPSVPEEPVSPSELIMRQQDILARNGENQRLRAKRAELEHQLASAQNELSKWRNTVDTLTAQYDMACREASDLQDESTAELEASIRDVENINVKIRANLDKQKAEDDARYYARKYDELSVQLNSTRQAKSDLLNSADLPLPGLSVEEGELRYNGKPWDCMSGSDQLKVSAAIVRRLKPECGFVLMDKLEQMDVDTLREFGDWLEAEGLQVIATRVAVGEECSVVIEDGYVKDVSPTQAPTRSWKAGEF